MVTNIKESKLEERKEFFKYYYTLRYISETCISVSKQEIEIDTFFKNVNTYIESAMGMFYKSYYSDSEIKTKRLPEGINDKNIVVETNRLVFILNSIYNISSINYLDWPLNDIHENIGYIKEIVFRSF